MVELKGLGRLGRSVEDGYSLKARMLSARGEELEMDGSVVRIAFERASEEEE